MMHFTWIGEKPSVETSQRAETGGALLVGDARLLRFVWLGDGRGSVRWPRLDAGGRG
jgi:hypothetical protein